MNILLLVLDIAALLCAIGVIVLTLANSKNKVFSKKEKTICIVWGVIIICKIVTIIIRLRGSN